MKNSVTTTYLLVAGLLLLVIGGTVLLAPHTFYSSNGIHLGINPNLLSEIRAPGGLLAGSGISALTSLFRSSLRIVATQLMVLVYGSFGSARLMSMALDGIPTSSIVGATIVELVLAAIGVAVLWRRQHL